MSRGAGKENKPQENTPRRVTREKATHKIRSHKFQSVTPGTQPKHHKLWTSFVVVIAVVVAMYFLKPEKTVNLALHNEVVPFRFYKRHCSQQLLKEMHDYPNCIPKQCGRFVSDSLVSSEEVDILLKTAKSAIGLAGSSGGASIVDLHSGALSHKDKFINAYSILEFRKLLTKEFLGAYKAIMSKLKESIAKNFLIDESVLHLTRPTFFSKISNITAKTVHDEYWHSHVDKEQYESFHYTSLVYLNTYKKDFEGGRFIFIDGMEGNETKFSVEPKAGRVNAFTSGHENVHHIERVVHGTRYALTVSFTCNSTLAVDTNFATRYND
ncbi:unnamed protein product [Hermetia illucens]|uniref:Fe2OG dioxygenase domain-containing protein n=1 Tax=Hermetia illucens TaxID=343691 RepID=A0A7R8UT62_HERIL|nr:2-oxoglutarate and iron-dependent oxygenase domain-containing protein 3-like [Hermetia illucens]CAD7086532.1 unnamed protein product [Hermetia illucens]